MDPIWFSAGALLVSLGTALYVRLSGPIEAKSVLDHLRKEVTHLHDQLESVGLRWEQYREGVDGLLEEVLNSEERSERTRRKTTQAAARLKRGEVGGNGEPASMDDLTPDQLRLLARSRGHQV